MAVKIYNTIGKNIRIRENGVFTAPELISDAGLYIASAGGYYAGGNIIVDGTEYAIIISPKSQGQTSSKVQWKTTSNLTSGTSSTYNGKSNTDSMVNDGINKYPAAQFCVNLNINGFNDWHLPSPDELEVCYRYLKPIDQNNSLDGGVGNMHSEFNGVNPNSNPVGSAYSLSEPSQTSMIEFRDGNAESFTDITNTAFWSSMQRDSSDAWVQAFNQGNQYYVSKTGSYGVRAVRWVAV